jgi:hypothetical protein
MAVTGDVTDVTTVQPPAGENVVQVIGRLKEPPCEYS